MRLHLRAIALVCALCILPASAKTPVALTDERGFINVYALRDAVAALENVQPTVHEMECETAACAAKFQRQSALYERKRRQFMATWGTALLAAIARGDEVAEVIWRQCSTTPVLERSALASTCDSDAQKQADARARLKAIGFDAAIEREVEYIQNQHIRDRADRDYMQQMMRAGVFRSIAGASRGGNTADLPIDLTDHRQSAALRAASMLVQRAFSYANFQDHLGGELRLARKPQNSGGPLTWSAIAYSSGNPSGYEDPLDAPLLVYTNAIKANSTFLVGSDSDSLYLEYLIEMLTDSEQRINTWLKRDPRWAVFLMHRIGHHEWVPDHMTSPFGKLDKEWHGRWQLAKVFDNFALQSNFVAESMQIGAQGERTYLQRDASAKTSTTCELRFSGGSSEIPEGRRHGGAATSSVIGYLPALLRISAQENGPVEPFAPMNPKQRYRQVLVQCPQAEWLDNRNKNFLFLANNTVVEIRKKQGSEVLQIRHWRRMRARGASTAASTAVATTAASLPAPFDLHAYVEGLRQKLVKARVLDEKAAELQARQKIVTERVAQADVSELIASLATLRQESLGYQQSEFPPNLKKLLMMPHSVKQVCATLHSQSMDGIARFNLVLVAGWQLGREKLDAEETQLATECLRLALFDSHPWVRAEAAYHFGPVAVESDLDRLKVLRAEVDDEVRRLAGNAIIILEARLREAKRLGK